MENITPFSRRITNFSQEDFTGSGVKFVNGDTLVARITPSLENGKTSYVDILDKDEVAFGSTEFIVLREKPNSSDRVFIYYTAISLAFRDVAIKSMTGTSGRQRVQTETVSTHKFWFPPLPEQKAIADVLSSFDDKIELLREQNKTLEAMAQALFKHWFVDFEFPNVDGKPYKSSGGKMVDSELGEIPDGWRVGVVNDLVHIHSGFAFKSLDFVESGKFGLVTIKNVQDGYFVENTTDRLQDLPDKTPDYCLLKTGDVLLSLTGNVGRVCYAVGKNYLLNQRVAKLEAKNINDVAFTYLLFRQKPLLSAMEGIASGTAQQNLSPIRTGEIPMLVPSREILDAFGNATNKMLQKMFQNSEQAQTLAQTRDALLPKLMRGEVRVNM